MIAKFNGDLTKMFCGGCVRFTESWREPGKYICQVVYHKEYITENHPACEKYVDRAQQQALEAAEAEQVERERHERWEKNKNNPPRPAKWKRDLDYITGRETGAMPFCPNCNEPLYEAEQCCFCGQRIEQDAQIQEFTTPPDEKRMDCFFCGGKDAMIYTESKYNGHKRGYCEKCGVKFCE